jgi:hypothetical protein
LSPLLRAPGARKSLDDLLSGTPDIELSQPAGWRSVQRRRMQKILKIELPLWSLVADLRVMLLRLRLNLALREPVRLSFC